MSLKHDAVLVQDPFAACASMHGQLDLHQPRERSFNTGGLPKTEVCLLRNTCVHKQPEAIAFAVEWTHMEVSCPESIQNDWEGQVHTCLWLNEGALCFMHRC